MIVDVYDNMIVLDNMPFLQGLKNSTFWCAVLAMSTFCWQTVSATFFCFDLSWRFAPTSVDEVNTFDVEDGNSPQHSCGERANSACDSKDHHEHFRSLDPCGQQIAGGESHPHGAWGLQRSGPQQPSGRLVVGNANRNVWGDDASNRHSNNVERKLHEPKVGQADSLSNTNTGHVHSLFSRNETSFGKFQLEQGEADVPEHQHGTTEKEIGTVNGELVQPWLQHDQPAPNWKGATLRS